MTIDVKQFLARQLNDHSESPSGVVQKTFYEWTEKHIGDAVHLGLCYLYSILPNEFSKLSTHTTTTADCVYDFCETCSKFLGIVDLTIEGESCLNATKIDEETNSLIGMFSMNCPQVDDTIVSGVLWDIVDGSSCVVKFDRELPAGSEIRFMCATPPEELEYLDDDRICQYLPLVADYALWWLFRTDSESRSNLERARLHFEGVRDFVTTKLLLEFSLQEDDYNFGRRKVDD